MKRPIAMLILLAGVVLSSCTKRESEEALQPVTEQPSPAVEAPAPAEPVGGPHAFVHLKDGSKVPGTIVASSQKDVVVAGDDGIERKIPLDRVKSIEYAEAEAQPAMPTAPREVAPAKRPAAPRAQAPPQTAQQVDRTPAPAPPVRAPEPQAVTTTTYELPAGSEISVRVNEEIDSETAVEGQTFDANVTRAARDANGDIVIPRGARADVVIKSASKGGRFRGASDLVLDLQSVTIDGKQYSIQAADVTQKGKSGIGANKRTATHVGGGAALGAIIGAIAGGGKGAAIGAGAGAGAGAITQILTKGDAIKVPAESVLTFNLDQPLKVTAAR
jgi:hypothetical protein